MFMYVFNSIKARKTPMGFYRSTIYVSNSSLPILLIWTHPERKGQDHCNAYQIARKVSTVRVIKGY